MSEESQKPLDRHAWNVLILAMIFWLADGYDTLVLLITARPTLHVILPPEAQPQFAPYLGLLVAITLAGWATGGILGGWLGDRLGRRKTMIAGVLLYSVATTLSAATSSLIPFALTRFFTGIGIGAEWGVGTSLLQEVWPEKWRTKGAGLLQSGFSIGGVLISGVWILVGPGSDALGEATLPRRRAGVVRHARTTPQPDRRVIGVYFDHRRLVGGGIVPAD